jgi:endonuclease VIII-like 1
MPELAEVRLMGDFINYVVAQEPFFDKIEKSEVSKVSTELDVYESGIFTIGAICRGKELLLHTELVGGDIQGAVTKDLLCNMGMSGNWIFIRKDSPRLEQAFKHGHLRIRSTRGNWLILYDPRRFAKWRWVPGFSQNRGSCPLTEYEKFSDELIANWQKKKDFNKPLNELMMNQRWFNGVGNYLRAEIIDRINVNPFQAVNELSTEKFKELIHVTNLCVRDAYQLGGGQLKDWFNPEGMTSENFDQWMTCYGKKMSIRDKTGRMFWFDKKWEKDVPESYRTKKA